MVEGTPLTLRIGLLAGVIGVALGATLAFISGYYGGVVDNIIRVIVDVGLTIPGLLILIIIAMRVRGGLTVDQMALVVGSWPGSIPRARSAPRSDHEAARLRADRPPSGMSNPEVIVKELLPNLLPYLGASLVGSVSAAILASIGLEVLGLGPFEAPTLGMTIYWVNYNAAIINGWWWWWVPPIVVIASSSSASSWSPSAWTRSPIPGCETASEYRLMGVPVPLRALGNSGVEERAVSKVQERWYRNPAYRQLASHMRR